MEEPYWSTRAFCTCGRHRTYDTEIINERPYRTCGCGNERIIFKVKTIYGWGTVKSFNEGILKVVIDSDETEVLVKRKDLIDTRDPPHPMWKEIADRKL